MNGDAVHVGSHDCAVTFRPVRGDHWVATVHLVDGRIITGPPRETQASARTSAWWRAVRIVDVGRPQP